MPICVGILVCFHRFSYDRTVGQVCSHFAFVARQGSRINLLTKMKRFSVILSALALVVLMQGCGKGVEPETPNNPVQLRLKGNISAIAPSTRVNADGFEANDKVGVYVSATGALASSGNMLDNTAFTYTGGNLSAPEGKEIYWETPETKLSVWAYSPYAESISNPAAYPFAVATDQSDEADYYNSDFITAQAANLAPQAEAVNLTFNHSMSKIAVTLKKGTGVTDEEWAAATKSLSVRGVVVDGTIDLATGVATAGTTKGEVKSFANGGVYSSIVYPQEGEITFRLEMDGDIYTYTTDADYEAGYEYDYEFTINVRNPQQMALNTTTITTWGDGGETEMGTMSDIISFTDPVFKEYLLNEVIYENHSGRYFATDMKIDANNDGEISIAEAEKVEFIDVSGLGITNLTELRYFSNLKALECLYNELTTLDVSNNTALTKLWCDNNKLTSLDVSKNTALTELCLWENQLTTLDVSKNTALRLLHCDDNQLTSLDVTKNTALTELSCWENQLTTLDVSKNTALRVLCCNRNQLTTLDISKNTALIYLGCTGNQLTSLDVTKNTALTSLYCYSNQLTSLDVSKNTALDYLTCGNNQLTTLDISKNTALDHLDCGDNQLTTLDVSKNTALTSLSCDPMNDAEGNNLLETIYIAEGQNIEYIDKPIATVIEEKE